MKSGVICLDFDGVVADTLRLKSEWLRVRLGVCLPAHLLDRSSLVPIIGADCYSLMQRSLGGADTLGARPLPQAVQSIKRIATCASIHVVTARSAEKVHWVDLWLRKFRLNNAVVSVVATCGESKAETALQLGAKWLVDNDPRHYHHDLSGKFLLFGRSRRRSDPRGISFAKNWAEAMGVIFH